MTRCTTENVGKIGNSGSGGTSSNAAFRNIIICPRFGNTFSTFHSLYLSSLHGALLRTAYGGTQFKKLYDSNFQLERYSSSDKFPHELGFQQENLGISCLKCVKE